jgi:hypothetical protein
MADLMERAQEREIDGVTYKVWPIAFKPNGMTALMRLLKIVAPAVGSLMAEKSKEAMASALFGTLPTLLSDSDLDYFGRVFGDAAQYQSDDGKWIPLIDKNQAKHFDGRYFAYFRWLIFCCEVNFGNFFDGIKNGVAGAVLPQAETTSK